MDKSDLDALSDVVKRAADIQQILSLTNIKGANYLLEYKLIDFMQILSLVKKCPKCNEYFFQIQQRRDYKYIVGQFVEIKLLMKISMLNI